MKEQRCIIAIAYPDPYVTATKDPWSASIRSSQNYCQTKLKSAYYTIKCKQIGLKHSYSQAYIKLSRKTFFTEDGISWKSSSL